MSINPIEEWKLDFEYVKKCTDKIELRKIVKKLRAEPFYPELTKAAEERLAAVDPKSKLLAKPVEASEEEKQKAIGELDAWIFQQQQKDERITKRAKANQAYVPSSIPPVRGSKEYQEYKSSGKKKKIRTTAVSSSSSSSSSKEIWDDKETTADDNTAWASSSSSTKNEKRSLEEREFMAQNFRIRGNEEFKRKRFLEALKWYQKSVAAKPSEAALTNSALMQLKFNRYEEAESSCTEALSLNPQSAKAFMRRGLAKKGLERYSEAIEDLEKALKLVDPKHQKQVQKHLDACEKERAAKGGKIRTTSKEGAVPSKQTNKKAPSSSSTRLQIIEDDDDDDDQAEEAATSWCFFEMFSCPWKLQR
mmetsp:Transcript_7192/g.11315  ORF Transcript_7192/g.11315 Transcript_7192/m.11315 type:complete len:363 (-) Transcript_7192:975-2063(-)